MQRWMTDSYMCPLYLQGDHIIVKEKLSHNIGAEMDIEQVNNKACSVMEGDEITRRGRHARSGMSKPLNKVKRRQRRGGGERPVRRRAVTSRPRMGQDKTTSLRSVNIKEKHDQLEPKIT